jgi:transcriptional regulator with XRE-family HTH domain
MNTVNVQNDEMNVRVGGARPDKRDEADAPQATTIKDVARVAGVSHATVSRVLNGIDVVRPATRARVLTAIDSTGWTRDEAAAALARRRAPAPAS